MSKFIENVIERICSLAPAYLRAHSSGIVLPPYTLAIFPPDPPPADPPPADPPPRNPPPADPPPRDPPPADPPPRNPPTDPPQRAHGDDGKFVSREEFERLKQHNTDLSTESATRRRENKDLRTEVEVLRDIRIRDEVSKIVTDGGAISERIVDLFIADQTDKDGKSTLAIDKKTGRVLGLDKLDDWKRDNAAFFKPDTVFDKDGYNASGFNKEGFNKEGFDKDGFNKDGKDKDGKAKVEEEQQRDNRNGVRPNRTSAGAANGAGSGAGDGEGGRAGLPDLSKCKDAAERNQVLRDWKRSLRGGNTGFGKASSRR